jgi:hypothetical protein
MRLFAAVRESGFGSTFRTCRSHPGRSAVEGKTEAPQTGGDFR